MTNSEESNIVDSIEFRVALVMTDIASVREAMKADVEAAREERVNKPKADSLSANRKLLRIEQLAKRDKELHEKSAQSLQERMAEQVNAKVSQRIEEQLVDTEVVYRKILGAHESLPDALDILNIKASSMSRIEPVIATMPWLVADILKMVNMPKYRRTDSKGKVIAVESLRMALSFAGLENLKMVVPAFAFRRWLPQITDPYPSIKSRLWDTALGTAISCRKIAQVTGQDEGQAFSLGMFSDIGAIVIIRLYFRLFDEVLRESLKEAEDNYQQQEFDALRQLKPSDVTLRSLIQQLASKITTTLVEHMDMRRVFIANAYKEQQDKVPLKERSPMGKLLAQGKAYSHYRNLKAQGVISVDEAKDYLREFSMPKGSLAALKQTDLRKIDMTFDDEK